MVRLKFNVGLWAILLVSLPICTFAQSDFEQQLQRGCAQIRVKATLGKMYYDQRKYNKALPYFEHQAAWTHFCLLNAEDSKTYFSEHDLVVARNNVGLTYTKMQQPLWARAWFLLSPESTMSQYNLKQLAQPKLSTRITGHYVKKAGFGQWSSMYIKQVNQSYQIHFDGYYFGLRGLIYGPNMGSFSITMPLNLRQATYQYEECKIQLHFGEDQYGKKIEAVAQGDYSSGECGFGHNVFAEGTYYQVEQ